MTTVVPRRFLPDLPLEIPRHWLPGDPVVSSILNTYTVLVPANEAFYIRPSRPACRACPRRCASRQSPSSTRKRSTGWRTSATGAISTPRATATAASSGRSTAWCSV